MINAARRTRRHMVPQLLLPPSPCRIDARANASSPAGRMRLDAWPLRHGGVCSTLLLLTRDGLALRILSALDVTWLTPLGPLFNFPVATAPGCNVTASRCRGLGAGFAVADPPPRFASGGLPFVL